MCAGVGSGGKFRKVPECWCSFRRAGVGSGGRFRKVLEGSGVCWCRLRRQVPEGFGKSRCGGVSSGGRFRKVPEADVCWCRFRRQVPKVPESSRVSEGLGVVCCLATLTGTAM